MNQNTDARVAATPAAEKTDMVTITAGATIVTMIPDGSC